MLTGRVDWVDCRDDQSGFDGPKTNQGKFWNIRQAHGQCVSKVQLALLLQSNGQGGTVVPKCSIGVVSARYAAYLECFKLN